MNPIVIFKQSMAFSVNVCVLINSWSGMALQTENVHLSAASTFLEVETPVTFSMPSKKLWSETVSKTWKYINIIQLAVRVQCPCHNMGWLKKGKEKMKSISSKVDIFWHFNSFLEAVSHSSRTPQKMGNIWLPSPLGQLGHPLIFVACQTG